MARTHPFAEAAARPKPHASEGVTLARRRDPGLREIAMRQIRPPARFHSPKTPPAIPAHARRPQALSCLVLPGLWFPSGGLALRRPALTELVCLATRTGDRPQGNAWRAVVNVAGCSAPPSPPRVSPGPMRSPATCVATCPARGLGGVAARGQHRVMVPRRPGSCERADDRARAHPCRPAHIMSPW